MKIMWHGIDDITHPCDDEGHIPVDQGCFLICCRCGANLTPQKEA